MNLEALAKLATEATPGPWRWYGQIGRHIMLTTVGRGIVTVMGAKRLGMQGAEPTFGVRRAEDRGKWGIGGVMTGASELAVREVRYRDDIVAVDHPDAAYIAAASPDVVLALVKVAVAARAYAEWQDAPLNIATDHRGPSLRDALRAALADLDR